MVVLVKAGEVLFDRFLVDSSGFAKGGGQAFGFKGIDLQAPEDRPWERSVFVKQYHDVVPGSTIARAMPGHFQALNERLAEKAGYLCLPKFVGEAKNSVIAVFPFVEGRDLHALLDEGLSEERRVRFAMSITNAVRILAKAGIAHLDLKPDNILIEENRKSGKLFVRLIDTDAARIDGGGLRGSVLGSAGYMSPEHFAPSQYGGVSVASDVFTLGVLLFRILFDCDPYGGREYEAAVVGESFVVPPNEFHKEVVGRIVSCLHPEPERRPHAGLLHSTLYSHLQTGLRAVAPADRWICRYVQFEMQDFKRVYYGGGSLGRVNFQGAGIGELPSQCFRLRLDEDGASLELVDSRVRASVGSVSLVAGRRHLLGEAQWLEINGVRLALFVLNR